MTRPIVLLATVAVSLAAARPAPHAGEAAKVHTVGKDGLTLQGEVAAADAKVKVIVGAQFAMLPAKRFDVRLAAGKRYRISLDSKDIHSVLIVHDPNSNQLDWDGHARGD